MSDLEYMRQWRAKNRDKIDGYIKKRGSRLEEGNDREPAMKRETAAQAAMWARLLRSANASQAGK